MNKEIIKTETKYFANYFKYCSDNIKNDKKSD